jgi:hypothetical protein
MKHALLKLLKACWLLAVIGSTFLLILAAFFWIESYSGGLWVMHHAIHGRGSVIRDDMRSTGFYLRTEHRSGGSIHANYRAGLLATIVIVRSIQSNYGRDGDPSGNSPLFVVEQKAAALRLSGRALPHL